MVLAEHTVLAPKIVPISALMGEITAADGTMREEIPTIRREILLHPSIMTGSSPVRTAHF